MDSLYYNGTILTMEQPKRVEAVLCRNGKILAAGTEKECREKAADAREIDLQGHTMLPAFLDSHSHFVGVGQSLGSAQLAGCKSFDEMINRLKQFEASADIPQGKAILGGGYDHTMLREKRHPDKWILDSAFPRTPVLISHVSNHMCVVNSAGLQRLGITKDTPDPDGGHIGRDSSGELTGYLEEKAYLQFTNRSATPNPSLLAKAQELYLSHGITTVQDGMTHAAEWQALHALSEGGKLKVDVVSYIDIAGCKELLAENPSYVKQYRSRLKIGGYKVFLDGSPQARTAWLTQPYEGGGGYRGYPLYTNAALQEYVRLAKADGVQFLAHCNGDAACQQFLDACIREGGVEAYRPVMVHAQTLRKDQIPLLRQAGILPSYFVAHTYYWGDVHLKNLGQRARCISPVGSTLRQGLPYTFHQDSPVLPPDMLFTVWCAVNRMTQEGAILGEEERITAEEALKGITLYAAYQYFEEDLKGSIRPGKLANFVILDRDPTAVPPMDIKDIRVLETIREDESVWARNKEGEPVYG